jgi:ribosomal protein L7/L12
MTKSLYAKAIDLVYYAEESLLAAVAVEVAKTNPSVFLKGYDNAKRTEVRATAEQTIRGLVINGEHIKAIKLHREIYGTSLGESKQVIDQIRDELARLERNG